MNAVLHAKAPSTGEVKEEDRKFKGMIDYIARLRYMTLCLKTKKQTMVSLCLLKLSLYPSCPLEYLGLMLPDS